MTSRLRYAIMRTEETEWDGKGKRESEAKSARDPSFDRGGGAKPKGNHRSESTNAVHARG